MNRKNIAIAGVVLCCLYFIAVLLFVTINTLTFQILFEIITMLSGIYFVFLILKLPFKNEAKDKICQVVAKIFVASVMITTCFAHIISLTVLQLIDGGVNIPEFMQLGKFPSIVTSIEYFGWGIFMGLAFLFSALGIIKTKEWKPLKITLFICSALCVLGYFGALVNENLWYIASAGYGLGTIIMCIEVLIVEKQTEKLDNRN